MSTATTPNATADPSTPPALGIDQAQASGAVAPGAKRWHVGTLTYTTAGIAFLFFWLLWGDFAWAMKERSVGQVVQFLLKKFQATDTTLAVLTGVLPAAITVVLGPVISYKSDRHRGRWGRRIPYLLLTTPLAAAAMVGLAFGPSAGRAMHRAVDGAHAAGENAWIVIYIGLLWTVFEFATIAANSVFGGLINDVVPRPLLGRFYGLFRFFSLFAGMIFNAFIYGTVGVYFSEVFIGVALLYGVGFTMMCLKVKEGAYPPPPPVPAGDGHSAVPASFRGFIAGAKVYCRECFAHPYYLWLFVALTLSNLAFLSVNLFSVAFHMKLNMSKDQYGNWVALSYLISLCLAYFLGVLADRFHPLRVSIATMVLYAVATLWGGLYATTPGTFAVALVAHVVLSGTFFTTSASIGQRLFPHSKFAQFQSAYQIVLSMSSMALAWGMGRLLDAEGSEYRYTYLGAAGLSVLALGACWVVHRQFMALGGPKHYVAPGEEAEGHTAAPVAAGH